MTNMTKPLKTLILERFVFDQTIPSDQKVL